MLVGFAIFKFFPHGGIQRDLLKLADECLSRGHRVRVYAGEWRGALPDGYEVELVEVSGLRSHKRYRAFHAQMLAHLANHPVDLLVGMNKMPGLDVYYAGDTCYLEKATSQRGWWYRLTPRYRHFYAWEQAVFNPDSRTQILTISDVETPVFQRHYNTADERFHRLPPGIERDRLAPADTSALRAEFRCEFDLAEDDLLLLMVGSGFRKKGVDRVLQAIPRLPSSLQSKLKLFVLGSDNARPFQRLARKLNVAAQVRFFPGRDDVPRFLFSADALVLPAYDEAAGMIILEAAFAGLPALVTENCGYAHYLEELGAGLLVRLPFSMSQFVVLLEEILTSSQRDRWRAAGIAGGSNPEYFQLAECAVDKFESFAAGAQSR